MAQEASGSALGQNMTISTDLPQGKSLNSVLFDAWAQCGEGANWESSVFLMSIRERHCSTRRGTRKWLTAMEMDQRFGAEMAQSIRDRKLYEPDLKRTETRFHPELPGVEVRRLRCASICWAGIAPVLDLGGRRVRG